MQALPPKIMNLECIPMHQSEGVVAKNFHSRSFVDKVLERKVQALINSLKPTKYPKPYAYPPANQNGQLPIQKQESRESVVTELEEPSIGFRVGVTGSILPEYKEPELIKVNIIDDASRSTA